MNQETSAVVPSYESSEFSDERPVLFVGHGHTGFSDRTEERYTGKPANLHCFDHANFVENLSPEFDAVLTLTDHYETSGIRQKQNLIEEFENKGGEAIMDDYVIRGELEGSRYWIINGAEAANSNDLNEELLLYFLPMDDENVHNYDDLEEPLESVEKNGGAAVIPHAFFPGFNWGEERRELFFDKANQHDVDAGVEYSIGYGLGNRFANGEHPFSEDVGDLVKRYDSFAVPGEDVHAPHMKKTGLISRSAIDSLEDDKFPTEEFKDMKVSTKIDRLPSAWNTLRDSVATASAFREIIPFIGQRLPTSKSAYRNSRNRSLKPFSSMSPKTVRSSATALNGQNGIIHEDTKERLYRAAKNAIR